MNSGSKLFEFLSRSITFPFTGRTFPPPNYPSLPPLQCEDVVAALCIRHTPEILPRLTKALSNLIEAHRPASITLLLEQVGGPACERQEQEGIINSAINGTNFLCHVRAPSNRNDLYMIGLVQILRELRERYEIPIDCKFIDIAGDIDEFKVVQQNEDKNRAFKEFTGKIVKPPFDHTARALNIAEQYLLSLARSLRQRNNVVRLQFINLEPAPDRMTVALIGGAHIETFRGLLRQGVVYTEEELAVLGPSYSNSHAISSVDCTAQKILSGQSYSPRDLQTICLEPFCKGVLARLVGSSSGRIPAIFEGGGALDLLTSSLLRSFSEQMISEMFVSTFSCRDRTLAGNYISFGTYIFEATGRFFDRIGYFEQENSPLMKHIADNIVRTSDSANDADNVTQGVANLGT